jgi:hypothetical protein
MNTVTKISDIINKTARITKDIKDASVIIGIFVFFGFEDDVNFAIVFGLTLVGFYIFRGGVNLTYNYVMAHFTEELYCKYKCYFPTGN